MSLPEIDLSLFVFAGGAISVAFLGSWHCAGMCGPIAGLAAKKSSQAFYQGGRLIAYLALGLIASFFGQEILARVPTELRWIGGAVLGAVSLWILFSTWNLEFPLKIQKFLWRNRPRSSEALDFSSLGLVTGLLPCHWLYGFVAVAAGLGSPLKSSILMVALWAGSVPWLLGASSLSGLARRFAARSPWLARTMLVLVVLGLMAHGYMHGDGHLGCRLGEF